MKTPALLSVNADAKTSKGTGQGWLTAILYLAPSTMAGGPNICPHASPACVEACLVTAGRASIFPAINKARVARTRFLFADREGFRAQLKKEVAGFVRKADRMGLKPALRLNGTSDLAVETLFSDLFEAFPDLVKYDYTKGIGRALAFAEGRMPANYHLTFSLSEMNEAKALKALRAGVNVAAVVSPALKARLLAGEPFQLAGEGFQAFDGDASDLRFLDLPASNGQGRVCLLKAKGKARHDKTGFVRFA